MRILLVAYHFPPENTAESIITLKAVRGLSALGYEIIILTTTTNRGTGDMLLESCIPEDVVVERTATLFGHDHLLKLGRLLPSLLLMPDAMVRWYPSGVALGTHLIEQYTPDIVYSRAQPFTSHLVAATLAKRYRLPWIAHFSDPLVDNAYYDRFRLSFHRRINKHLERCIMQRADQVHFVSRETLSMVSRRYSTYITSKFRFVPHSYDSSLMSQAAALVKPREKSPVFIMTHAGYLNSIRTPLNLLKAISLIVHSNDAPVLLRLRLVGRLSSSISSAVQRLHLEEVVEFVPHVSYLESLSNMLTSDVLVLIDAKFPVGYNVFFPSKLVDYLATGHPVLGITPSDSTSARILQELGHLVVDPSDIEGISSAVRYLISSRGKRPYGKPFEFDSSCVTQQLNDCLWDVIGSHKQNHEKPKPLLNHNLVR